MQHFSFFSLIRNSLLKITQFPYQSTTLLPKNQINDSEKRKRKRPKMHVQHKICYSEFELAPMSVQNDPITITVIVRGI